MKLFHAIAFAAGVCTVAALLQGCYTKSDFDEFYDRTEKCEGVDEAKLFERSDAIKLSDASGKNAECVSTTDVRRISVVTRLAPNEMTGGSVIVKGRSMACPDKNEVDALVSVIAVARDHRTAVANVSSAIRIKFAFDDAKKKITLLEAGEAFPALTEITHEEGTVFPMAAIESVSVSKYHDKGYYLTVEGRLTLYRNAKNVAVGDVRLSATEKTDESCSFVQSMTWEGPLEPCASGKFAVNFDL